MRGSTWPAGRSCVLWIRADSAASNSAISAATRPFRRPAQSHSPLAQAEFASLFRGRRLPIKAALLNQALLAGVGNIYADESLFQAGIRPRRRSNRLTLDELERLRAGAAPGSQAGDPAWRVISFRLRRCRRRTRLLSTRALRIPADRGALPPLPNAHPPHPGSRPRDALLPELPALRGVRMRAPRTGLCFFEESSPFCFQNSDN